MPLVLPDLPYSYDALAPAMSEQTLTFHHKKHHNSYVETTNKLTKGTALENDPLEDIILKAATNNASGKLLNAASQAWNHAFFWSCMAPKDETGEPDQSLAKAIDEAFGSLETFKKDFSQAATGQFGSGWAWLYLKEGKLEVASTPNADTPLTFGAIPLLTCDVWEHAYYLDYQNERGRFVKTFVNDLINWSFVNERYAQNS